MEKITISKAEYQSLLESQEFLNCLESCGVDNWIGYDDAVAMYENEEEEEVFWEDEEDDLLELL